MNIQYPKSNLQKKEFTNNTDIRLKIKKWLPIYGKASAYANMLCTRKHLLHTSCTSQ